mmetsp:Transcript_981/g.1535  ORF Transcript_981/g.1535 Transcript_981/m.1535 type:complete len:255 (+) Transcript_981:83-847(+)
MMIMNGIRRIRRRYPIIKQHDGKRKYSTTNKTTEQEKNKEKYNIIILDTETTGRSSKHDFVIELAAVRIVNHQLIGQYASLINVPKVLTQENINIHNISNEILNFAPEEKDVFEAFKAFIQNYQREFEETVIVGHNIAFDMRFINTAYERLEMEKIENDTICTMQIAKRLIKDPPSYSLNDLTKHVGLPINTQAHRAMPDVNVTSRMWKYLYDLSAEQLGFQPPISFFNQLAKVKISEASKFIARYKRTYKETL